MDITNKEILKCLPLLASALGDKYGIEITMSGKQAYTDGKRINLPQLPLECDEEVLCLVRGYIDHEAAHVRFTDFNASHQIQSLPLFHLYNIIEDWRIEKKMSEQFSGCEANLLWLSNYLFSSTHGIGEKNLVPMWLLYTVRSWLLSSLEENALQLEHKVINSYPNIVPQIQHVLLRMKKYCPDSKTAIAYALEIAQILKYPNRKSKASKSNSQNQSSSQSQEEASREENENNDELCGGEGNKNQEKGQEGGKDTSSKTEAKDENSGEGLLAGSNWEETDLSKSARKSIDTYGGREHFPSERISIAKIGLDNSSLLSQAKYLQAQSVAIHLKNRLQGLLQAKNLVRSLPAKSGKIHTKSLYKLSTKETRIFSKATYKKANDTAIHILVDTSSSMHDIIDEVSTMCFTLVSALIEMKDIKLAVTTFPALLKVNKSFDNLENVAVNPILKHGEKLHRSFLFTSDGGTPMSESLWWVIMQMIPLKEKRKIILLLTDGLPNNISSTQKVFQIAKSIGIESYGIALPPSSIKELMPQAGVDVENIMQLPQVMFDLFKKVLLEK